MGSNREEVRALANRRARFLHARLFPDCMIRLRPGLRQVNPVDPEQDGRFASYAAGNRLVPPKPEELVREQAERSWRTRDEIHVDFVETGSRIQLGGKPKFFGQGEEDLVSGGYKAPNRSHAQVCGDSQRLPA